MKLSDRLNMGAAFKITASKDLLECIGAMIAYVVVARKEAMKMRAIRFKGGADEYS